MATVEQLAALYGKRYEEMTPEEKAILAGATKQDWDNYAISQNSATAQPGHYMLTGSGMQPYTGWNGGSVTGADMMAAVNDAQNYGYDIQLDPRNNAGARDAINEVLLNAGEQANLDAINGIGDYETNRQNYLNQIGWTNYQDVFKNLQTTGKLGLNTMKGNPIEQDYGLGNPNFVWTGGEPEYDFSNQQGGQTQTSAPGGTTTPGYQMPEFQAPQTTVPTITAPDLSGLQGLNYAPQGSASIPQSEYLAAMQQMLQLPEYQGYDNAELNALLNVPQVNTSIPQSEYLAAMQGMTLPEYQQYVGNLGDYAALPEQQALDLSALQSLTRTPEQLQAYMQQLQALQEQYKMPEVTPFSYDPAQDSIYQAYLQQFTRDANQGMQDTLGQISARTGGMASSYAGQAAQQTYNQHMQKAADILPTMNEIAYNRWLNEQQMKRSENADAYNRALDALDRQTAAEQDAWDRQAYVEGETYNRQQDAYNQQLAANQAEWERQALLDQLNYNRQQDAYNQQLAANQAEWERQAYLDELLYGRQLDEINRQTAQQQADWERRAYVEEQNYNRSQDAYNQQLAANQAEWERQAYLDELLYGRQLDEINRQKAAEQEAWDRQAYVDAEAYARQQDAYNQQLAAEQQAYERKIYEQQMAADQQAQNANLLLSLMANYGYMPTAQELAAAGLSQGMANAVGNDYQNQLAMQWANINNKASSGGTGDVPQATDYLNALQSAGVKDMGTALYTLVNAGMKVSDAETLASYYMDILDGQGGSSGGNNAGGTGGNLPSAVVNEAVLRVNDYLSSGTVNQAKTAMNYVERIWDDLSEAEKQNIAGMFAAAGYRLNY